jgi:hypothetical protein
VVVCAVIGVAFMPIGSSWLSAGWRSSSWSEHAGIGAAKPEIRKYRRGLFKDIRPGEYIRGEFFTCKNIRGGGLGGYSAD